MASTPFAGATRRLKDGRFSLGSVINAELELARGNPNLIWGWKRDVGPASRIIYFGGQLIAQTDEVVLSRWYVFYRHRASTNAIERIADVLRASTECRPHMRVLTVRSASGGFSDLRLELGQPDAADTDRVRRLQLRRPRRRFPDVVMPPPLALEGAAELLPADIYVGSGLSYEAGLPTLCDMHLAFGVDNPMGTQFAVGEDDLLPARLASDLPAAIGSFCAVHVGALRALPTPAMHAIALLQRSGLIRKVFTDNVDNMLTKVNVPFERTRGSGVFNERYPATFESGRLIVVGVAADRRSLVQQARAKGMQIITVNPCEKVAPMVRHLDYIRPVDPFFQVTADSLFGHLARSGSYESAGGPHQAAAE